MKYILGGSLMLLGIVPAMAQETPEQAAQPEEIVVTATKAGQRLDRAPVAASSIDAGELARLHVQSVRDAQVLLPSVVYNDSGGSAQVYIRGIGSNSAYAGLESSIGTYVDGVYLQRQVGASVDVVDLKSIEVLNGPQGSLYGRNATGGVVLVNTNDPTQRFEGMVRIEAGNFGRLGSEAMLNIPISSDLALRVAGKYTHLAGYTRNVANGDRLSGFDAGTVRAKLKWTPGSRLTAIASVEYHKELNDPLARRTLVTAPLCVSCAAYGTTPPTDFYKVDQTKTRKTDIHYLAGTLNLKYEGDGFDVVSVTGVRDFHYAIFVDQDFARGDLYNSRAEEFGTTLTEDAYVRTRFDGPFNFLAGLSGELDKDSLLIRVFGSAFGPLQDAGGTTRVKLASISPYGEAYLKLSDSLKLTVGGRYNIDTKKLRAINNAGSTIAFGAVPFVEQKITFRNFTPRVVLSRETPTSTIYASYSKGVKSGGYNSPAFTPLDPLRPEELTSYEAGLKANGLNGRIQFSAAAFYYDYKDIQVSYVNAATGGIGAQNAASARIYGLEMNTSLRVTDALTLHAGGLVERARFRHYTGAAIYCPKADASPGYPGCPAPVDDVGLAPGTADLSGGRIPRAPELSFSVGANYGFPITDEWKGTITANDRYTSDYDLLPGAGGPLRLSRQKAYHFVTLGLSFENEQSGVEARLFVNNVTKARYFLDVTTSAFGVAGSAAAPRTFGGSLAYRF
ncbi:TonB-dependent receptor [Rhizorhapis suberifaciens]|uniref:Iron complex outermembrane receptor protein n=1 Tax=Rhizorhapis suberifaciens TaxID=13656 RepID=A0A840HUH2_9SPHN|nr:TonB-dependent receptor [Rhizorhapis suberifaciens]MBB4641146.1 iron complex outermembrane receptor protein [Rhizorhapis suberifaciens]